MTFGSWFSPSALDSGIKLRLSDSSVKHFFFVCFLCLFFVLFILLISLFTYLKTPIITTVKLVVLSIFYKYNLPPPPPPLPLPPPLCFVCPLIIS